MKCQAMLWIIFQVYLWASLSYGVGPQGLRRVHLGVFPQVYLHLLYLIVIDWAFTGSYMLRGLNWKGSMIKTQWGWGQYFFGNKGNNWKGIQGDGLGWP